MIHSQTPFLARQWCKTFFFFYIHVRFDSTRLYIIPCRNRWVYMPKSKSIYITQTGCPNVGSNTISGMKNQKQTTRNVEPMCVVPQSLFRAGRVCLRDCFINQTKRDPWKQKRKYVRTHNKVWSIRSWKTKDYIYSTHTLCCVCVCGKGVMIYKSL